MDIVEELQIMTAQNLKRLEVDKFYQVMKQLGKGTYGRVDLVVHKIRGTKMALKFLKKKSTKRRSFLREYSVSLFLSPCPFVVNVLGIAFETDDCYVFAQEYAPTGDLFDIIPPQVGLPEAVAKRCVHQVAVALDYMHCRKLVHRDIKPENVLIFDRECRKVKLSDFGMTRRAGSPVRRVSGTIPYTAPELCDPRRQEGLSVGPGSDVWALGVLLFCMLTGNFPWEKALAPDPFYQEFVRWQRRRAPAVPSQWRRFTRQALGMFQRLLSTQPERRSSVTEVFSFFTHTWLNTDNNSSTDLNNGVNHLLSSCSAEDHLEQLVERLQTSSPPSPADVDLGSGGQGGAATEPLAGSHFVSVSPVSSLSSTNSDERPASESECPGRRPIEICV